MIDTDNIYGKDIPHEKRLHMLLNLIHTYGDDDEASFKNIGWGIRALLNGDTPPNDNADYKSPCTPDDLFTVLHGTNALIEAQRLVDELNVLIWGEIKSIYEEVGKDTFIQWIGERSDCNCRLGVEWDE